MLQVQFVKVNILPTTNLGPDQVFCVGDSVFLDAGNAGSVYHWSSEAVTQLDTITIGDIYSVKITNSKGCIMNDTIEIVQNSLPVINLLDKEFCLGDSATLDAANTGLNFLWNTSATTQTIKVKTAGDFDVLVTDSNGCIARDTAIVTVNTLPLIVFGLNPDSLCASEPSFTMSGGIPVLPNEGLYSGSGMLSYSVFDATTAGVGAHELTYTYTDKNGCVNTATDSIYVLGTPIVGLDLSAGFDSICYGTPVVGLVGGTPTALSPATGVYSGVGVVGGDYSPANASAGSHVLTYVYADAFGCADSAKDNMNVLGLPLVIGSLNDDDLCLNDSPLILKGALPIGGVYKGVGMVSNTTFDPSVSTAGRFELTYIYTDQFGCSDSLKDDMTVHELPIVTCDLADDAICADETPLRL